MPLLLLAIPMSFASSDLLPVARSDFALSRGDTDTLSSLPVNRAIDRVAGSDHFPSVSPFGEPSSVAKATKNEPFRWRLDGRAGATYGHITRAGNEVYPATMQVRLTAPIVIAAVGVLGAGGGSKSGLAASSQ